MEIAYLSFTAIHLTPFFWRQSFAVRCHQSSGTANLPNGERDFIRQH